MGRCYQKLVELEEKVAVPIQKIEDRIRAVPNPLDDVAKILDTAQKKYLKDSEPSRPSSMIGVDEFNCYNPVSALRNGKK